MKSISTCIGDLVLAASVLLVPVAHAQPASPTDMKAMMKQGNDKMEAMQMTGKPDVDFASTDANVPLGLGIPAATLNGGGIGDKAHSPDEWYEHVNAWQGPQILLLTTLRLAGVDGHSKPVLADR